jgi:catechol 2,3-dioxygenase
LLEHAVTAAATHPSGSQALLDDATRLGAVELRVTDLERSIAFYTGVVGLSVRERSAGAASLGAAGDDLVVLREQPAARPAGRHSGLYHFALLFPTREELARAGRRIAEGRVPIDGASDHGTHEAIYLPDPDGIGVELAADRPRQFWPLQGDGRVLFAGGPAPLDIPGLFATIEGEPSALTADPGLRMGHVHLYVGDLRTSTRFYRDGLGFEVMADLGSAVFVSAARYHHYVGYNLWRGVGAPPAPPDAVGLVHWTLETVDAAEREAVRMRLEAIDVPLEEAAGGFLARDPAGIEVRVR